MQQDPPGPPDIENLVAVVASLASSAQSLNEAADKLQRNAQPQTTQQLQINAGGIGQWALVTAALVLIVAAGTALLYQQSAQTRQDQENRALREEIANINAYRSRDEIRLNKLEARAQ